MNTLKLTELLIDSGASFVGFPDVAGKLPSRIQHLHYAVTVGVRLSDAIIDEITDKPSFTYFHHYRTVNTLLDQIALRGLIYIQQHNYNAMAVPASQTVNDMDDPYRGIFPHKTAAVMAGLGSIGKNGLFLHKTYGPRVRLATILTDMPLVSAGTVPSPTGLDASRVANTHSTGTEASNGIVALAGTEAASTDIEANRIYSCSSCNQCVDACPAMALTGSEWYEGAPRDEIVDAKACSEYMNLNFKQIGRGSVCGICIRVCPAYQSKHIFTGGLT